MLRIYFLSKFFVALIKGSVSPQFKAIFGKLNFWRNIDRRGPYKNGENLNYFKLCLENNFCQNYLLHSSKEVFLHNFRQFLENWIFDRIWTGADLTKMVKIWTILNCDKKIFYWQNYLFNSSKEMFLHNFKQFLENWIFDEISTGAYLTKMVKIWTILNCAKQIFFVKIICSTHQRKSFSTILSNFWKIEFLTEYRQARVPYKNGENLNYLKLCLEFIFCQNYLLHSSKEVFLHNF